MADTTQTPPAAPVAPKTKTKDEAVAHLNSILQQAEKENLVGKVGYNPFFIKNEFDSLKVQMTAKDPAVVQQAIDKAFSYSYSESLFKVHAPKELPKDNPESKPAPADKTTTVVKVPLT